MRSHHRVLCGVAVLAAVLTMTAGCAAAEDEAADAAPPAPVVSGGSGFSSALPSPDAAVKLDPVTKGRCDAVWSLGVFVYSAHTAASPPPAERQKLLAGVIANEPKAVAAVPELAADFKALSAHAQKDINATAPAPLSADLSAANQRLIEYLRTTCKFKQT